MYISEVFFFVQWRYAMNDFQDLLYDTDLADVFMNLEEFGESISYTHSGAEVTTLYAVLFDDPSTSVKIGQAPGFVGSHPQFMISEAALLHSILKRDTCIVKGKTYGIEDFESDGVGVTTVFLRLHR